MTIQETAQATLEFADDSDLGALAEILARHVLAGDATETQTVVPLAELMTLTRRYAQLCTHVGAEGPEGRKVLDAMLDGRGSS